MNSKRVGDPVTKREQTELQEFPWGEIRWSVNADLSNSEHLTVGHVIINGKSENPRHYHPNCDEVVFVVSGHIEHLVNEDWHKMSEGDAIHVPQGVWHQARNLSDEPARLVISYNTGRRQVVGEGL